MARFCSECGSAIAQDDQFCRQCGATVAGAPVSAPTDPTQPQVADTQTPLIASAPPAGDGGWWSNGRRVAAAMVGAFVLIAAIVAGVVLVAGGGSSSDRAKPAAATATTVDPAIAKAEQDYLGYVQRIANIVQQSASGRGQVGALVSGVENGCRISPFNASQQIRTVIDNRTSILNQLAGLSAAPNPEAQSFYSLLQQALQSSINADAQYKGWFDYLYDDYYYTVPVGCPGGTPPKNAAYNAARAADDRSTDLKTQFVNAFNPIAARFGQPTFQQSDF